MLAVVDTETVAGNPRRYLPLVTFDAIDPQGDTPVWLQVYEALRKALDDGTYPPRTPMPSVRHIQEITGISRPTITKAYNRLRSEGRIRIVPGKGPFVAPR